MLQDIKIFIEELVVNIQMEFFLVLLQSYTLNYWKMKEICKHESKNRTKIENRKINKI